MELSVSKLPEPLVVWEKIEILTSSESNAGLYVARIEDFDGGGMIITQPELIKGEMLLRNNCKIILHLTKSDAVYRFHSMINKTKTKNSNLFYLSNPVFIERIQRRNFSRVVYSSPVEYTLFTEHYKKNQQWYKSLSWDISGNGILLETKDFVKKESLILLKIKLFEAIGINLPVLGRSYRSLLDNNTRLSGVGFIPKNEISGFAIKYPFSKVKNLADNFDNLAQEKLIAFVFNEQIEQRNKGLL